MRSSIRAAICAAALLLGGCVEGDARDNSEAAATPAVATARGDAAPGVHAASDSVARADSLTVTVYKSPTCVCCGAWVDHMRGAGFHVVTIEASDMNGIKAKHGVTNELSSCHTATVGGYVLEGHVPAADVRRLLTERPGVMGLAVAGMPKGSPGMEGPVSERYDVIAFSRGGGRSVFASH